MNKTSVELKYKNGTPAVWLEIEEDNSPSDVVRFEAEAIAKAYKANENKAHDIDKLFAMWAVNKYIGVKFNLDAYIDSPWEVVNFGKKDLEVRYSPYQTGKLFFSKNYKLKSDALILVIPWGYDATIVRKKLLGWIDARGLRIRSMKEESRFGFRKTLKYEKLMPMSEIMKIWEG